MKGESGYATGDPRSIVTPEAFEIAPELLGRPIASPWRRLAAILVDVALIGLLTRAGGLLLGLAAVAFFFRMAAGRERKDALARTFRVAVGCFGAAVLLVTGCSLWAVFGPGRAQIQDQLAHVLDEPQIQASAELADVFGGISEARAFRGAETPEEAVEAAVRVARRLERIGAPRTEVAGALRDLAPADAPWSDRLDAVIDEAMSRVDRGPRADAEPGPAATTGADTTDPGRVAAAGPDIPSPGQGAADPATDPTRAAGSQPDGAPTVDSLTLPSAVRRYVTLYQEGPPDEDTAEFTALRRRIAGEMAGDTLDTLRARLEREATGREAAERSLERTRRQLEDVQEGWLFGPIRRFIDDLGLAFGWGTIYMTIFLSWWNGRTPGKKLLGIRVVQLDGTPISWWEAFERGGGYAAGFATGLLGFAQVFWDPNRQAIHDKISETVVVRDGAERVPSPWDEG